MTSSYGQPFSQPKNVNPGITKKEEDQKYSASEGTGEGGASGDGSDENSYQPGLFNFGQIMDNFFTKEVAEDDTLGQLQKSAFEGNMVQTALDAQLAGAMADKNAAIAQENMAQQADLEKLNSLDLMQAEFGYNELSKESNFNYENSFANSQYDRDVGMLAATGEQQRDNIKEQSNQDRLSNIVAGEQQRLTDAQNIASQEKIATGQYASNDYRAEVAADASKFGASESRAGSENVAETQAGASMYGADKAKEAQVESTDIRSEADKDIMDTRSGADIKIGDRAATADENVAYSAERASKYGADRQLEGVEDTNITSTRNIRTTGDETRSTQNNEQRLKARERADMSRYSRSMARAN
jgi:hypothetical protein